MYRFWCFTAFTEPAICTDKVAYYIYQQERTTRTDRLHWQGYIELSEKENGEPMRMRFETVKRRVLKDNRIHIEKRQGTQEEAIKYCKKKDCEPIWSGGAACKQDCRLCCFREEWKDKGLRVHGTDFTEWGTQVVCRQGERTDIEKFMEEARSGASIGELREKHNEVCAKYHTFVKEFVIDQQLRHIPAWRTVETTVYWGHTGMGKTRRIFYEHPDIYKLDPCEAGKVWWCGYAGEDVILLDDFYGWIAIGMLLNILDGYKVRLQIKGSFTYAAWTKVFITSNVKPEEWYKGNEYGFTISQGQRNALMRRLTNIVHVSTEWLPPTPDRPALHGLPLHTPEMIALTNEETNRRWDAFVDHVDTHGSVLNHPEELADALERPPPPPVPQPDPVPVPILISNHLDMMKEIESVFERPQEQHPTAEELNRVADALIGDGRNARATWDVDISSSDSHYSESLDGQPKRKCQRGEDFFVRRGGTREIHQEGSQDMLEIDLSNTAIDLDGHSGCGEDEGQSLLNGPVLPFPVILE